VTAPESRNSRLPLLHARTVPLDYGPDALQFDGSPTVLFDRSGLTLVGWGTARLVRADEAAEALAAIDSDDPLRCPGSGPLALGALPYEGAMAGHLVVPRFTMGISRDADVLTRRWVTAVGPVDTPLPGTDELFEAVIWQYGTTPDVANGAVPGVTGVTTVLSSAAYREVVARAVDTMRAPGATLRKVVLSRPVTVELDGSLALSDVLRRLRAAEPTCTVFSMPVHDGTFFGATPELLVGRHGRRVTCHPLAGTVRRGDTARSDAEAQRALARSAKEREEHRYVVEDIASALEPWCDELLVPEAPSLVAFSSVAHLGTRMEGTLSPDAPGVLGLLGRLHPTPAVGGTPRAEALEFAAQAEGEARGPWAGPVGWVDGTGDGEWMIGIRSALLHGDGRELSLRAGAGIVAASDPAAEAVETDVKLATVIQTVLPGRSVQLR
jgi:menaquinone-specific isochorismate synthase